MAGYYADIPGTRFALDQDGSVFKVRNFTQAGPWTDMTSSVGEALKANTANYVNLISQVYEYAQVAVAFPEARTISGIYAHFGCDDGNRAAINFTWEYSTDTTDGTDGTWVAFTVTFNNLNYHCASSHSTKPYYRSDIAMVSLANVKGIRTRFNLSGSYGSWLRAYVIHIYGDRPLAGVNRLAFWNPTSDQALGAAYLDFGDISQSSVVTRQFRIKNLSGTLTAGTTTVAVSDLLPEYTGTGIQLSTDNITYQSSINIGNLAPGSISSILYVRRSVPSNETTTQRQARLLANAATWS